ncbi:MAG: CHAT domain-containing tetratricopeptide repeat protein [Candidatus Zixiibacteriota bacterium]
MLKILYLALLLYSPLQAGISSHADHKGVLMHADSLRRAAQYDSAFSLLMQQQSEFADFPDVDDTIIAEYYSILGVYYYDMGQFSKAENCLDSALLIRKKIFGESAVETAEILVKLGNVYREQGQYEPCEKALVEARNILEKIDRNSVITAECYEASVPLYIFRNDYEKADTLAGLALAICEGNHETDGKKIGDCYIALGNVSYFTGHYDEAEEDYKVAIDNYEKAFGSRHPLIAMTLGNLGNLYSVKGEYQKADSIHSIAFDMESSFLGPDHYDLAIRLNNRASLYWRLGRFGDMEPLLNRAIGILKKTVGPDHPEMGASLNSLAAMNLVRGNYQAADSLFKEGLQVLEKVYGTNHNTVATIMNNLGNINALLGNYDVAKNYMSRALLIRKNLLGPDHNDVANSLGALARLHLKLKEDAEAESCFNEALRIKENLFGTSHPDVARIYSDLGDLHRRSGRLDDAVENYRHALTILQEILGNLHPNVYNNVRNLAQAYGAMHRCDSSLAYYGKFIDLALKLTDYAFSYSSESQKLVWINQYPVMENSLFSLAISCGSNSSKELAAEMILKGKASVIDAVMAEQKAAYCSEDAATLELLDRRNELCTIISNMVLSSVKKTPDESFRDSIQFLYNMNDSLEVELSRRCALFKDELQARRFNIGDIGRALKDGEALLEYLKYYPYDFSKAGSEATDSSNARYLAFVVTSKGGVTFADIGDAGIIDSLVDAVREEIYQADNRVFTPMGIVMESDLSEITGNLYKYLIAPLADYLEGRQLVYVSPDSKLNLIPFEILTRPDGKYLIETNRLCYLSTGRELLRLTQKSDTLYDVMIVADPDFNYEENPIRGPVNGGEQSTQNIDYSQNRNSYNRSVQCLDTEFPPLRFGQSEMKSITDLLTDKGTLKIYSYYGSQAAEKILKSITIPPSILHLATHGFFCDLPAGSGSQAQNNPLVRSGLALAGVNRLLTGKSVNNGIKEDGLLTAYEISGLNLNGTQLAVLSACETGVGEALSGEGVFGLQRAFRHAGARSILMSLWKIMDKETSQLMQGFYRRWLGGQMKVDALRDSQLEQLAEARRYLGHGHPLAWAGFILIGDPH